MKNRKDFYFRKAKEEGYVARSIYKLLEINKKYNLIKNDYRVLDLGSSPGFWVKACLKLNVKEIIGVDIIDVKIKNPKFTFIKDDINKIDLESLGRFDVVISDMAPKTMGNKFLDSERSIELSFKALEVAKTVLKKDGNFLVKVFQGSNFEELAKKINSSFEFSKSYKPKSTRKESKEIYIIAKGLI